MVKDLAIGVMICARNEEGRIQKVLDALARQTPKPRGVVVVDDESSDATGRVAARHELRPCVLRVEERHRTGMGDRDFAEIRNIAYSKLAEIWPGIRLFLVLDADLVPPDNYLEVLSKSLSDEKIAVASGKINGESSHEPRAGCRLVSVAFFEKIGGVFPAKIGCETYVILRALQLGYKTRIHDSLIVQPLRKTRSKAGGPSGWAMRAHGYHWLRVLFTLFTIARSNPRAAMIDFISYATLPRDQFYDDEFRKFMRNWSRPRMLSRIPPSRFL